LYFLYFFNTFIIFDYYIIIYYYDNGNEGTCCNFTSMFQTMFSSMFSSMFTRDRGFIFILTNIFEILKIYLGNFLETYLYHTCTEEYKPSITSKHTWKHTWKHTLKHTCKVTTCTFISVVIRRYINSYEGILQYYIGAIILGGSSLCKFASISICRRSGR